MKTVGYIRVSTTDQIEGTSLDSQRDQIEAYARMKGLGLVAIYQDPGVSGGKPLMDRPEGAKMLDALESGEAQAVVICKLDRGFRSASDCLNNVEQWEKDGISLHILNLGGQTIDTGSAAGKFFITVMAGAAELERNLIRERCNEGRKIRKAQGFHIGGDVPYGYDVEQDTKRLVISGQEQEAMRLIDQLHAEGHSYRAIAAELNRRGLATKKGRTWTHRQVGRIIKRAA